MVRRIANGVGANIVDKLVVTGTQLVMVPLLVRAWGLQLYGLWVLLATVPTFLSMGDFGFGTAAGTKMTMAQARGDREEALHIFQSAWTAILISSILLSFSSAIFVLLLPEAIISKSTEISPSEVRLTILSLSFYGLIATQGSILFAAFRSAGLFALGAFWNASVLLFESGATVMAVLTGAGPLEAAATMLCARTIGLLGQGILLRTRVPWLEIGTKHATPAEMKRLVVPAIAVMLLPIAQACSLQGSALALGAAAGQAVVPAFTTARTFSRVGLQMCWLLNTAIMPEYSAANARHDRRAQALMVLATIASSTILVVPYSVIFGVLGQRIILIWTDGMICPPSALVFALAGSVLLGGVWYPISNLILATNRHASYTGVFVTLALFSIPATYLLALYFGATGAGLTIMIMDLVMFIVIFVLARRLLITGRELRAALFFIAGHLGRILLKPRASAP